MNAESDNTSLGDISVDNEAIKNIALKAATDIQGIHKIRKGIIKKIWALLFKKDYADGLKLEFTNSAEVKITLKLMVEYGVNIPYAAGAVQEAVKKVVEYMTGLAVTEVIVKIIRIQAGKNITLKEETEKKFA
jgi:uncharacterized alkaline shock family protein YloU